MRRFEELATPCRVVDGWHENAVLQVADRGVFKALGQHAPQPCGVVLGGQPEAQKAPSETSATKDAGTLSFEQGFEFNGRDFCGQPQGQHPACRGAADQVEVRSDWAAQHGFKLGKNRRGVQAAIAAPRQGEHMVGGHARHGISLSAGKTRCRGCPCRGCGRRGGG